MKRVLLFLFAFLLFAFGAVSEGSAQSVNVLDENLKYNTVSANLARIEEQLKKKISSNELAQDIDYLHDIRSQLESSKKRIEFDIKTAEKRLEALGAVPEDGHEIELIAQKRKQFSRELAEEKARQAEVELLMAKLDEIDLAIFNLRNEELWGNLLVAGDAVVYPKVFINSGKDLLELVADIAVSPFLWYQNLTPEAKNTLNAKMLPVALTLVFITVLGWVLRRFILRRFGYRDDVINPRFGRKVWAAISVWIAYGVIPTFIISLCLLWMISGKILTTGFFGMVLSSCLYYSLFVIMGMAVCRVIFTPYHENWRLINVSTERAKKVTKALYVSVILVGILSFLQHIVSDENYPIELMTFLVAVSAIVKAFCVAWVLQRLMWTEVQPQAEELDAAVEDAEDENLLSAEAQAEEDRDSLIIRTISFAVLGAVGIAGLSLFGYPYLALFIINRIIFSIVLIISFVAVRRLLHEILHRLLFLKFWARTFRMRRRILRKLDFWSSFLIDPSLAFCSFFAFLALWGVPTEVLRTIVYKLFTGFTVGGMRISLLSIILGLIVFFVLITLVKSLRPKIENNMLARMDMDEGTRHSLASGFSSVGYVASGLLAIVIMGGNLTSLALVAGALSVGIGLGLQNVVNNFVSGIILLFERPVKVGDWVVINGEEGRIKQINIRSTEVETFRKSSLIIPNANLLSTTVTNLTHGNNWSRQSVSVGVAYGSDTEKVKRILLECAAGHKRVLRKPEPYVLFKDFGASSLDFELRCYTNDIWTGWNIPSDLRYEINRRFNEEGIEIPFNQLVVHTGSSVAEETQDMFYASKKRGKKNAN